MGRLVEFFIQFSRPPRRLYRYLSEDETCLGFVKAALLTAMILLIATAGAQAKDGKVTGVLFALAAVGFVLFVSGGIRERAAQSDRPLGETLWYSGPLGIAAGLDGAYLVWLVWDLAVDFKAGSLFFGSAWVSYMWAYWGSYDREGGGKRSLSTDLKRLLRRSPRLATGNISRQLVPVLAEVKR